MKRVTAAVAVIMSIMLYASGAASQPQAMQGPLRDLIGSLSKTAPPPQADQIANAIKASPQLAKNLTALVAVKKLTEIRVVPQRTWGKPFGAVVDGTALVFTTDFVKSQFGPRLHDVVYPDDIPPNNLVFCLGHLSHHLRVGPVNMADFATPQAYSSRVLDMEAAAFIQGWNDVIDAAVLVNRGRPLNGRQISQLSMNLRYRFAFLKAFDGKPSLHWSDSGAIDSSPSNISALATALRTSTLADIE